VPLPDPKRNPNVSFGPPPSVYTQSSVAADQRRGKRRAVLLGVAAAVLLGAGGWLR
jgi:hypothetical protein